MAAREYGQFDGVTRALELVGERWALLIVRDLLVGPRRYGDLAAGLPRIPSNILAARLKDLQAAGVLRRVPHSRVVVYELTAYGHELEPIVLALGAWGSKALGDPREEQIITPGLDDHLAADGVPTGGGGGAARDGLRGAGRCCRAAHPGRRRRPSTSCAATGRPTSAFAAGPGIHRLIWPVSSRRSGRSRRV